MAAITAAADALKSASLQTPAQDIRLASGVLGGDGMVCPRCPEAAPMESKPAGDLCAEHALAALEQVRRRLADTRALLESAIQRARVLATA